MVSVSTLLLLKYDRFYFFQNSSKAKILIVQLFIRFLLAIADVEELHRIEREAKEAKEAKVESVTETITTNDEKSKSQ